MAVNGGRDFKAQKRWLFWASKSQTPLSAIIKLGKTEYF